MSIVIQQQQGFSYYPCLDTSATIGLPGNGGRPVGARNKLHSDFVTALANDFREHGEGTIRIVRVERPAEYLKIIASTIPRELLFGRVIDGMEDDELDTLIEDYREELLLRQKAQPLLIEAKPNAENRETKQESAATTQKTVKPRTSKGIGTR
jgi:hypothetical protein